MLLEIEKVFLLWNSMSLQTNSLKIQSQINNHKYGITCPELSHQNNHRAIRTYQPASLQDKHSVSSLSGRSLTNTGGKFKFDKPTRDLGVALMQKQQQEQL